MVVHDPESKQTTVPSVDSILLEIAIEVRLSTVYSEFFRGVRVMILLFSTYKNFGINVRSVGFKTVLVVRVKK